MKAGLTKSQKVVLDAIKELTVDGVAPSYDEIAARIERSKGQVAGHLVALRDKGWIAFAQKARSIRIIEDGQPTELETASTVRLRAVIEEATDALATQIGHTAAADILAQVLTNRRQMAKKEAQGAKPKGGPRHRFQRKSGEGPRT